jgi:hypothetical protein
MGYPPEVGLFHLDLLSEEGTRIHNSASPLAVKIDSLPDAKTYAILAL